MNKKKSLIVESRKIAGAVVAMLVYSLAVNMLTVPAGIYCGGLFGMCQLVRTMLAQYLGLEFQFDIASVIYYALNVPILIYAWFKISRRFLIKTLISLSAMTFFMSVIPLESLLPDDRLAACVVGALMSGAAGGMVLRMGASAGGFDVIGLLMVLGRRDMSVGKVNLFVNAALFLLCGFMFEIDVVIYSMIFTAVYSFAVDKVHYQNIVVEAKIVTKKDKEIEKAVRDELQRGLTKWSCIGTYTNTESTVLWLMLSKYEVPQLRLILRKYDPNAFMVLGENLHIQGNFLKRI